MRSQWLEARRHVTGGHCNNPNERFWYPRIGAMEVKRSGHSWIDFGGEATEFHFGLDKNYERNFIVQDDSKVAGGMELQ